MVWGGWERISPFADGQVDASSWRGPFARDHVVHLQVPYGLGALVLSRRWER